MVLIGIFILGTLVGAVSHKLYINTKRVDDRVKARYLKEHISKLEADAKRSKKKKAYGNGGRSSKKGGASGQSKGASKAKSGRSKSSK